MTAAARFDYQPLPVFKGFHTSLARHRFIVGGYGSGKSHALCAEAIALGLEHPGCEVLVLRKTVPSLKATTERILVSLLPPEFLAKCKVQRAGGHIDFLQFPNGSLYYFRGCDDWKKHRSLNLAFIVWDEADEFTQEDYDGLQSRLRQTRPTPEARALGYTHITRNGNIIASNPRGHNFLFDMFVDPNSSQHREDSAYWVSTSFDNPYLPVATLKEWLAMPDPWVRRFVLCSFDEFAGAIYGDWSYDTHVIDPFKDGAGRYKYDPANWFRMGYDPGTHAGNAALWIYNDRANNRLVGVAEYCETGLSVSQHARAWQRIEATHGMRVQRRIADPKRVTHRDTGSNMKLSDMYRRAGFNFALGPGGINDRVWGLGELIAADPPRFVITKECPRAHEQILGYRWDDLTPRQVERGTEAKPLKKDVDIVDAAQYAVSRYVPPPKVVPKMSVEDRHTKEIHAAIRKQIRRGRTKNATGGPEFGMM